MKRFSMLVLVFLFGCILFYEKPKIVKKIIPQFQPIQVEPEKPKPKPPTINQSLIKAHNDIRSSLGKSTLEEDPQLMQIAQNWADHMAKTHIMRHQALKFGGWMGMGENIAMGQNSVEEVMQGWMHSPGHKRNILGNYTKIGVAVAIGKNGAKFWCVDFGKK